jgi:hypothetical protein
MPVGQVYGTGTAITSGIEEPTIAPQTSEEKTFWGEVDKFKAKADEAYRVWQGLRAKRQAAASNPQLQGEYDQVMDRAEGMTAKVSDVEKAVASVREGVAETITGWFGLEGYRHAARKLGGLGLAPVLIAVVTAAIAWIGSWLADAYVVDRKLDAVENLTAQGVPISEAGAIIAERGDPGALEIFAGRAGMGVALAGLAAVVLYFFFEKKRGF